MSRLIDADALLDSMWKMLYALEDKAEKDFVGTDNHDEWFYTFRPWLQRGHEIGVIVVNDAPTIDAVSVSTLEQIKWERDSFAEQIREIGGEPFAKWDAMDVAKVVRCKDCKYYNGRKVMNCSYHINAVKENDFCSYGEKVTE